MFEWLLSLFTSAPAKAPPADTPATAPLVERCQKLRAENHILKAKYDAAQTDPNNARHWKNADGLSAALANNGAVRRVLRNRSRYEAENGGHYAGMIRTRADDLVGCGPTLQIGSDNDAVNEQVEKAFAAWAGACGLVEKLHTMDKAELRDGEAFALLTTNATLADPVKLDVRPVEADLVADPRGDQWVRLLETGTRTLDGVEYDAAGNPVAYTVLREYPDERTFSAAVEADRYAAEYVIHSFVCDRPGQLRGVPELTASLPIFPYLRRWRLATLSAAEIAASFAAMLETEAPDDGSAEEPTPFETLEIERGVLTILPAGGKMHQLTAEHPATTHTEFLRSNLSEAGRPLSMPIGVILADSSQHNYSSAKLDHYFYRGGIRVRRSFRNGNVMEKIFRAWHAEARLVPGLLPAGVDALALPRQWAWPGWPSMDKDDATQDTERLLNGTDTLAGILGEWGLDWKDVLRQRGREVALMEELGIPLPGQPAPADAAAESPAGPVPKSKPMPPKMPPANGYAANGHGRGGRHG